MNFIEKQIAYETKFNKEIVDIATKELQELGPEEYYKKIVSINPNTTDELQRAKQWIYKNVFNYKKIGHVLDAGCGIGEDVYRFEKFGNKVLGIDKSKRKMDFLLNLMKIYPSKWAFFLEASVLSMPFFNKWFDVCYSSMVVEHLMSPIDGLKEMARVARNVCGIIHMGEKEEDNPYHAHFLQIDDVKYYLDDVLKPGYKLEILDKYVFAMFYGEAKCKGFEEPMEFGRMLSEDLGVSSTKWYVVNSYCKDVEVQNIVSVFSPNNESQEKIVEEYVSCIKMFGHVIVEDASYPIRLIKFPDGSYRVWKDGSHRVCALKQVPEVKSVRAFVIEIKEKE